MSTQAATIMSNRSKLSETEIALINEVKTKADEVRALMDRLRGSDIDVRWWSIAQTELQIGFMALTRSIAQTGTF